jgi:hypothetical protein
VGETEILANKAQSMTEPDNFVNRLICYAIEHQVLLMVFLSKVCWNLDTWLQL